MGFALSRWFGFNKTASTVLSRFAFNIALPAMLFRLLSNLALTESHADLRLLIAFFGACFILFFIGRFVSGYLLKMKPVETAIFGTGCVFSNNGLLGLSSHCDAWRKSRSFGICGIVFKRLGVVDLVSIAC
ncbi:MAG: AEC family transporter [Parasutterella sp.]